MLILSVLRTPCTKPIDCHYATSSAVFITILLNNCSYGSPYSQSIYLQKIANKQSANAARIFLFWTRSPLSIWAFLLHTWKLPNLRKDYATLRTMAAFSTLIMPLQKGSLMTSQSAITRLRARVVGTPSPAISSETRNYLTAEVTTLLPSACLEKGLSPLPLSWSQQVLLSARTLPRV